MNFTTSSYDVDLPLLTEQKKQIKYRGSRNLEINVINEPHLIILAIENSFCFRSPVKEDINILLILLTALITLFLIDTHFL